MNFLDFDDNIVFLSESLNIKSKCNNDFFNFKNENIFLWF